MPKKLPQYAYRERNRHGNPAYYFRKGKGKRYRLPDRGAGDFQEKYDALLAGMAPTPKLGKELSGSLAWLIERYRESAAYRGLAIATRRQRDNIFAGIKEKAGLMPAKSLTKAKVAQGRDDRAATPHQARHFLDTLRGLFEWATEAELAEENPTIGIKNPPRETGDGFEAWTEGDVAAFEAKWPRGSHERLWLRLLAATGLRRGDAVVFGRQHVKDGWATLRTEKTGMEAYFPLFDELVEAIGDGPIGDLAYIVGKSGQPLTKESFGNLFRKACNAAGVRKSAHGLRKLAATRAVEKGLTPAELDAMFGWADGRMSSHYTRKKDRQRLARSGADKIRNVLSPHLEGDAPHPKNPIVKSSA